MNYEQRDERFKEANRPVKRLTEELERVCRAEDPTLRALRG